MTFIRRHPFVSILLAVLVTVLITVVLLNLSSGEKKIQHRVEPLYGISDEQFARSMGSLLGPPLVGGNVVIPLRNGDQIFPAMLAAIKSAQKTITFETYIYWSGKVGKEFADALSERARAGVKVHLLVDWVGSDKMDSTLLKQMTSAGVVLKRYHPIRWYTLSKLNNRTHRKILVVDGRIGFTGGVGVADHWLGNAEDKDHWRDSQFQVTGEAVAQMQSAFLDNWMKTTGEVLHGPEYFPPLDSLGGMVAQMFRSSPGEGSESVRLMYLLSIASARQSILLSASYFIPDDLSVETLVAARKRGVKIQIIVPGPLIDAEITRKASRARWGPLLESGIEIYEYMPTMFHCKIMVVDTLWTSVGSTNFDNRSFRLNDEANLNVLDRDFALTQVSDFEADLKRSRRITLDMWRNRPWHQKFMEHATALLRSQL
jgi:cardiolipin synthase A/B